MTVTLLTPAHLPEVAALEALCFHAPWSEQSLRMLCGEQGFGLVCLTEEGRVAAYVGVLTVLDEGQITNVATHPDFRRRGCANAVLTALLDVCRKRDICSLSLEVRESNAPAIALYEKHGFQTAGKRPGFYSHPREAALVMVAEI